MDSHTQKYASVAENLIVLTLAWSVLAFGAVYPWAYWPLIGAVIAIAALQLPKSTFPAGVMPLSIAFACISVAIGLQLIPLPLWVIGALSPETVVALRQLDVGVASGVKTFHSLSIEPSATARGLLFVAASCLLLLSTVVVCSTRGARLLAEKLLALGVLVALIGIIQKPLSTGKIYGFWQPLGEGVIFGPFVNRNHFAGWMLMVLPLAIGLIAARAAEKASQYPMTLRSRVTWLGTLDGNRLVLLVGASIVMAMSLVMTTSRSGMILFATSIAAISVCVVFAQRGFRRAVMLFFLTVVLIAVIAGVGGSIIANRFDQTDQDDIGGRVNAWKDAYEIAARFPVTGTGTNTYGSATVLYQRRNLALHYSAAHNDYFQLAAEGGFLLAVPVIAAALLLLRVIVRRFQEPSSVATHWIRLGALVALLAIAAQELVEFSLQIPANAALSAVVCGIVLHKRHLPQTSAP
ncbi:MAG: O-antigen ligase family protein [Cyanobacteria bacterium]|nr:O-antigen ligase family protein [Cyanobacteriota bacterium]